MLSRPSRGIRKYMLVEMKELIWVNVSVRRTQPPGSCPISGMGQELTWREAFFPKSACAGSLSVRAGAHIIFAIQSLIDQTFSAKIRSPVCRGK